MQTYSSDQIAYELLPRYRLDWPDSRQDSISVDIADLDRPMSHGKHGSEIGLNQKPDVVWPHAACRHDTIDAFRSPDSVQKVRTEPEVRRNLFPEHFDRI